MNEWQHSAKNINRHNRELKIKLKEALLLQVENSLSTYEPHACVVVYSVVARASFQHAEETLNYLWREGYTQEKSVIVVGNKADLARSRVITANGWYCTRKSSDRCVEREIDCLWVCGARKLFSKRNFKLKSANSIIINLHHTNSVFAHKIYRVPRGIIPDVNYFLL